MNDKQQRFFEQMNKAKTLLNKIGLYDYIDGLKYCYSFSLRYRKNIKKVVDSTVNEINKSSFNKCLEAGILKEWNNTYWFDKVKAESLQQFIIEHRS